MGQLKPLYVCFQELLEDKEIQALSDKEYRRQLLAAMRGETNLVSRWVRRDAPMDGAVIYDLHPTGHPPEFDERPTDVTGRQ
jgi:hypothetical protein